MGTKMAPSYANIFMHKLEDKMLSSFPLKPSHYYLYIDDFFFIWTHGRNALELFKDHVNSFHESIKFTFEVSNHQIAFLDVLVKLDAGTISTSLYCKPTDKHLLLHFDSVHPKKLKKSIVYSQCLRTKRICSDPADYDRSVSSLTGYFLTNGYPIHIIKQGILKAASINRQDLLSYKTRTPNTRIPMVLKYHPLISNLASTLKQSFVSLKDDPSLSGIFSEPPLLALRQPPNLRRLLTSSKLLTSDNISKGNTRCNKRRCQICKHITTEERINIPDINFPIIPPNLNCDSCNVVYILLCNLCKDKLYVGETGTSFRLRFNNHKQTIRDNALGFPVAEHFNLPHHSIENLKVILIANNFMCAEQRKRTELVWIMKLKSHMTGLNKDLGILNHYTFQQTI